MLLTGSMAGETVQLFDLRYQWSPQAGGPWEDVPPAALVTAGDGSVRIVSEGAQRLFRISIGQFGKESSLPVTPLEELPEIVLKAAQDHLNSIAEQEDETGELAGWRKARLSPFVLGLGTGWEDAQGPRYAEIKVIAGPEDDEPPLGDFLPDSTSRRLVQDRGYLIMSLDRSDFPILQWSTEGGTPSEELLRLASARPGARIARIMRFGPTLLVAEDAAGKPVANLGTEPFKVSPEALDVLREPMVGVFESEDERQQDPPPQIKAMLEAYEGYEDMKKDLRENPFHVAQRRHRERLAGYAWDALEGRPPEVLAVGLGETRTFLQDRVIQRVEPHWEEPEETPLARIAVLRGGGIQLTGTTPGSTLLSVFDADGISRYVLSVTEVGAVGPQGVDLHNTPDLKVSTKKWHAGTWSDQKRYHQTENSNWCRKVGCGPTSLAMLFGWWDHKGVPSAFYRQSGTTVQRINSLRNADAPTTVGSPLDYAYYNYLHDLCDVICFGLFSDSGATWPGDLIEAVHGYLAPLGPWWPFLSPYGVKEPLVGYSTSWAWDAFGDDWHTSGKRVADGIIAGRPGIVGLGVLWHYVVAFGYQRRETYIESNGQKVYTLSIERFFRCNEGWGKENPAWYSAYDVFLGLRANLWQKALPSAP
jgi:hypothetical protein